MQTATVPTDLDSSSTGSDIISAGSGQSRRRRRLNGRLHALCQERQDAKKFRAGLIEHVGGSPSAPTLALIDALAELKLKLIVLDKRFIEDGGMSLHARREYLAFVNSYNRLLRELPREAVSRTKPRWQPYAPPVPPARASTQSSKDASA
jgi:hypothetical protein